MIATGQLSRRRSELVVIRRGPGGENGARTGCGKVSDGADSKRGRNRRITGGLPEGSES